MYIYVYDVLPETICGQAPVTFAACMVVHNLSYIIWTLALVLLLCARLEMLLSSTKGVNFEL